MAVLWRIKKMHKINQHFGEKEPELTRKVAAA